jgi:hypothetical protein
MAVREKYTSSGATARKAAATSTPVHPSQGRKRARSGTANVPRKAGTKRSASTVLPPNRTARADRWYRNGPW